MNDDLGLIFEWDRRKAALNVKAHGISFDEASTVFHDPLGITIVDPEHSESETRLLQLGMSLRSRLVVVSFTDKDGRIRIISAVRPRRRSETSMKKQSKRAKVVVDDMRPEYDFSKGVRGKYAARYAAGTNIVVLDPDVAREFASSEEVNDTLRALLQLIRRKNGNKKKTA
jgi:uncharacterized DUF497 family protein